MGQGVEHLSGMASTDQTETVVSGLQRQANEKADACAIRLSAACITYGELYERSSKVAQWISMHKLNGQRIGIKLENGAAFFACFYGIVLAGAIAVPLPADLPAEQLAEWRGHLGLAELLEAEPGIGGEEASSLCSLTSDLRPALAAEQLFYMAVSSGSTGMPKGILRTHRSWVESFQRMKEAFGTGGQDRLLLPGPLHYSASLIAALQVLHEGGEVVLTLDYRSETVLALLLSGTVTSCFMVPAMYAKLLAKSERITGRAADQPLTEAQLTFISAGDKLPAELAAKWQQAFVGSTLYEYYGAAEISFVSFVCHRQSAHAGDSVGQPFPGVEIMIRDDQGNRLTAGAIGEVYVNSSMVAEAYGHWQAPPFLQRTAGGYTVGDLGYLDEAGCLHLVGRKQDAIVRGGVNLYPAEIERTLLADPAIAEAAVFGLPDQMLGERIVAAIALAAGQADAAQHELAARLASRFARARRPDEYWAVSRLPRNAAGKIDKRKLKEAFLTQKGEPSE